jgi:hypothetical protein
MYDRPELAEPLNVNVNQFNGVNGALAFIVISKCVPPTTTQTLKMLTSVSSASHPNSKG